jgi:hypothetical protein
MLCPNRYDATANSSGIVGGCPKWPRPRPGASKNRRPWVKTSRTMAGSTILGRKSVRSIHW